MLKRFTYEKANGERSERVVYVISPASDNTFTIDLTEFNEEERSFYETELQNLYNGVTAAIADMGLNNNYRLFKESRIIK